MTPDPIPAIRQRAEKATPGPWKFQVLKRGDRPHGTTMIGAVAPGHQIRADPPGGSYPCNDGEFIANAREDIPTLLDLWDSHQTALRALVERWDVKIASLGASIIGLKRESRFRDAEDLRSSWLMLREMRDELTALLPPKEGQ